MQCVDGTAHVWNSMQIVFWKDAAGGSGQVLRSSRNRRLDVVVGKVGSLYALTADRGICLLKLVFFEERISRATNAGRCWWPSTRDFSSPHGALEAPAVCWTDCDFATGGGRWRLPRRPTRECLVFDREHPQSGSLGGSLASRMSTAAAGGTDDLLALGDCPRRCWRQHFFDLKRLQKDALQTAPFFMNELLVAGGLHTLLQGCVRSLKVPLEDMKRVASDAPDGPASGGRVCSNGHLPVLVGTTSLEWGVVILEHIAAIMNKGFSAEEGCGTGPLSARPLCMAERNGAARLLHWSSS